MFPLGRFKHPCAKQKPTVWNVGFFLFVSSECSCILPREYRLHLPTTRRVDNWSHSGSSQPTEGALLIVSSRYNNFSLFELTKLRCSSTVSSLQAGRRYIRDVAVRISVIFLYNPLWNKQSTGLHNWLRLADLVSFCTFCAGCEQTSSEQVIESLWMQFKHFSLLLLSKLFPQSTEG